MALSHAISAGMITSGGVLGGPVGTGGSIPSGTYLGRSSANGNLFEKYNQIPEYDDLGSHATHMCIRVVKTARAFNVEVIESQAQIGGSAYTRWYEANGTLQNLSGIGDSAVVFQGADAVYTGFRWIVDSMTNAGVPGNTIAGAVWYHPTTPATFSEYGESGMGFSGLTYHNSSIVGYDTVNTAGDYRAISPVAATAVYDPAVYGYGPATSDLTSVATISLWARAAGYQDTNVCTFKIQNRIYAYLV